MKKTVTTKEGYTINLSIENEDGTPISIDGLKRLENMLLEFFLKKAEPDEDELFILLVRSA